MKTKTTKRIFAIIIAGFMCTLQVQAQTYGEGNMGSTGCTATGTVGGCTSTYVGSAAGAAVTANSTQNTFIGASAGTGNKDTKNNTAVGFAALALQNVASATSTYNTAVGDSSLYTNAPTGAGGTGQYNTAIGGSSGFKNSTGQGALYGGYLAGYFTTTANYSVMLGFKAGYNNTTGTNNICVGADAGYYNQTGTRNTIVGYLAGFGNGSVNSNNDNSFFGWKAGGLITTGGSNAFFGKEAGYTNSSASNNSCYGFQAGFTNATGADNTYLGYKAGTLATNGNNTFIGSGAGDVTSTGALNTFVGFDAGGAHTTGGGGGNPGNVFVGYQAGLASTTENSNTCVGYASNITAGINNATVLGKNAVATASNQMRQGDANITTWYMGGGSLNTTASAANLYYNSATGEILRSTSSGRYKKDIVDIEINTSKIYDLRPVTYTSKGKSDHDMRQFGLIAEEVAKVIPELVEFAPEKMVVADSKSERLIPDAVQYSLLPVLLLKEIQKHESKINEQQKQIEEAGKPVEALKAENAEMKNQIAQLEKALAQCCTNYQQGSSSSSGTELKMSSTEMPSLEQNTPNPFRENTVVKYYIPKSAQTAQLVVYSTAGIEMMNVNVTTKGVGQTSIAGNSLSSGIYSYCLIIDGKVVDVKQMILTK